MSDMRRIGGEDARRPLQYIFVKVDMPEADASTAANDLVHMNLWG